MLESKDIVVSVAVKPFLCCIFRMIIFLSIATEATAIIFRDKFRALQPIRYSARRQSDESTPPTSPTPSDRSDSEPINSVTTNSSQPEVESFNLNESNLATQINSQTFAENSSDETQIEFDGTAIDSVESTNQNSNEVKNIMPDIEMGEEESFAIESVFDSASDDGNSSDSENTDQQAPEVNLALGETAFWDGCVLKVRKKFDRDCEITYTFGEKFVPKVLVFEIKVNDLISMNIPFKENVSTYLEHFFSRTMSKFDFC